MSYERYPHMIGVNYESMVDGAGVRAAIFFAGCSHQCPGCQNPSTWDPNEGKVVDMNTIRAVADEINKRDFVKGITLTGGDPLYNPTKTLFFVSDLMPLINRKIDIWLYTGYTWETLMEREDDAGLNGLLHCCDVVVDGPFIKAKKDRRLKFRGSSNQRIIDVKQSLIKGEVVIYKCSRSKSPAP